MPSVLPEMASVQQWEAENNTKWESRKSGNQEWQVHTTGYWRHLKAPALLDCKLIELVLRVSTST